MAKRTTLKQPVWRKYLPILVILAVAGGFGVWKLVDSFAATGLNNGSIYVKGGRFTNQNLKNLTTTVGYDTNLNDEPIFSPHGNFVAYVDYITQEDSNNSAMSLMSAKSDGTNEKLIYRAKRENNEWLDSGSISWSRDGKLVSFITTVSTTEGSTESRFINVAKPDGTELKRFGFSYSASSSDGGSLKEATFSGTNPNVINYLSYGMRLCSLDIVSEARQCNEDDIKVANASNSSYQIEFWKLKASGNYIYATGHDWEYKDDGTTSVSHNIFKIDVGLNSALNLTNFPVEQVDNSTHSTYLYDVEPSPDGSKVMYSYEKWSREGVAEPGMWRTIESKIMSINVDGTGSALMQDNMSSTQRWIGDISWQPRSAGVEAPLPVGVSGGARYSLSELTIAGIEKKDAQVIPTFNIVNDSVIPRDFAVNITRTINGNQANQSIKVSVGPEETKTVKLDSFLTPYAKNGIYAQESGNLYSIRVTDFSNGNQYDAIAKPFALPMPPFNLSSIGSSVTVKKGTTVTFRGKTLPNKLVILNNKTLSTKLGTSRSDAEGRYVIKYVAKESRVVKLCLNGFENIATGCKKIKLNVN